jgi:hypothetical protein
MPPLLWVEQLGVVVPEWELSRPTEVVDPRLLGVAHSHLLQAVIPQEEEPVALKPIQVERTYTIGRIPVHSHDHLKSNDPSPRCEDSTEVRGLSADENDFEADAHSIQDSVVMVNVTNDAEQVARIVLEVLDQLGILPSTESSQLSDKEENELSELLDLASSKGLDDANLDIDDTLRLANGARIAKQPDLARIYYETALELARFSNDVSSSMAAKMGLALL